MRFRCDRKCTLNRRTTRAFVSGSAALLSFLYTWLMASAGNLFANPETEKSSWITAFCDGGSRGNPGPAGYGVYIQDENGAKIAELSEFLGKKTNNFAEYSGLL